MIHSDIFYQIAQYITYKEYPRLVLTKSVVHKIISKTNNIKCKFIKNSVWNINYKFINKRTLNYIIKYKKTIHKLMTKQAL